MGMILRFVDKREISDLSQLTEVQRAQLRLVGRYYDGQDLDPGERLAGERAEESEASFLGFCSLWRVVEGEREAYDAWFVNVDSGTFFRANTTEKVAAIIQFGLECEDPVLEAELGPAMVEAKLLPWGDSSYERFAKLLADRAGT
jgi:hypothetical protein